MNSTEAHIKYNDLITKLKLTLPYGNFNDLSISDYFKNRKTGPKRWLYNRHHICEIDISGSRIMQSGYANSESIIVDTDTHCVLHYLIILSGRTRPDWGMRLQFDNIHEWEESIRRGCRKYNIPFDYEWQKSIRS